MLRRVTQRLVESAAAAVDVALKNAVAKRADSRTPSRSPEDQERRLAFLEQVAAAYPEIPSPEFFDPGLPIEPSVRHKRDDRGRQVLDLYWSSRYTPFLGEVGERYTAHADNAIASARLFVRENPRPMVVLVHGYMSGHYAIEQRIWPIDTFDDLGFDAALFVLPFHAKRAGARRGAPLFPARDPRFTIEGFRQAVGDLTGLVRYLRGRGHDKLGLLGMSLGGYTASLAATVEPDLDFLVPIVPLACLADFNRDQGFLGDRPNDVLALHAALETAHRSVSPLLRPSLVPKDRVLVVGARADRITPIGHARRIATHFSAPLVAFRGGHLLQLGRERAFDRVYELMERVRDTD